ncbi:MAG TPA: hypothetical protein PK200_06345 [Spirochaetota bacterium]|nr:hypothetical protein [Spirochaetota bacterium]HQO02560.1 hypothetical protein [Spirochaetota bacterium]
METAMHECFQFCLGDVKIVVPAGCFIYEKQLSRKDTVSVLKVGEGCAYSMTPEYVCGDEPVWIDADTIQTFSWRSKDASP